MAIALFTFLSPITPMCVPVFHSEQFDSILPQCAFSSVPWFYSWPSFSETPFRICFGILMSIVLTTYLAHFNLLTCMYVSR